MKILELGQGEGQVARAYWPDAEIDLEPDFDKMGEYDVILSIHVLQRMQIFDVHAHLDYLHGCLREGGEMIVMVPDLLWAAQIIAHNEDVDKFLLTFLYGTQEEPVQCAFTMPLLRSAMDAAGLEVYEARTGQQMMAIGDEWKETRQLFVRARSPEAGDE